MYYLAGRDPMSRVKKNASKSLIPTTWPNTPEMLLTYRLSTSTLRLRSKMKEHTEISESFMSSISNKGCSSKVRKENSFAEANSWKI